MKILIYVMMLCCLMMQGCSDNEPEAQATEQTKNAEQSQAVVDKNQTEGDGTLNHYPGSVEMAKEARRLQEEADRKQKELEKGI
jgi:hypothetical protein